MNGGVDLSIIIVFYDKRKCLYNCLKSIFSYKIKYTYEVIVVNNSKKDFKKELKRYFKRVKYIKSKKNIGYGGGNNLGVKYSKGKHLLILNPDTRCQKDTINELLGFLEKNKTTAIAAPKLIDPKGNVLRLAYGKLTPTGGVFALSILNKIFPNNIFTRDYRKEKVLFSVNPSLIDAAPGSAFVIRKTIFEEIGGFDENIFLYFEEHDLGIRIQKLGYSIYLIQSALVIHEWHSKKNSSQTLKYHFLKSRYYYFKKHYGLFSALVVELFARISKIHLLLFILFLILILFYN